MSTLGNGPRPPAAARGQRRAVRQQRQVLHFRHKNSFVSECMLIQSRHSDNNITVLAPRVRAAPARAIDAAAARRLLYTVACAAQDNPACQASGCLCVLAD